MDFLKKIQIFFAIIIVFAMVILILNWYDSYSFKNNPIPLEYRQAIDEKEQEELSEKIDNIPKSIGENLEEDKMFETYWIDKKDFK